MMIQWESLKLPNKANLRYLKVKVVMEKIDLVQAAEQDIKKQNRKLANRLLVYN